MRKAIAAAVYALTCASGSAAMAQDSDWDFFEDPDRALTQAGVEYAGGQAIAAQCLDGALSLVIMGLPESPEMLRMQATREDGRSAAQIWLPLAEPGTYRSTSPGREARFMRGGGDYSVRTGDGAGTAVSATFDLPPQSANLDRVLTACGWALEDDRDLLPEATVSLDPTGPRYEAPPYRPPPVPEREISCIVRDMQLRDCRADHPPYENTRRYRDLRRFVQGSVVYALPGTTPADSEGSVYHVIASNQVLIMVNR